MRYFFTCRGPMDTKLRQVLTYSDRLLSLKPYNSVINVTVWKIFISLSQDLWLVNMEGCLLMGEGTARLSHQLIVYFIIEKWGTQEKILCRFYLVTTAIKCTCSISKICFHFNVKNLNAVLWAILYIVSWSSIRISLICRNTRLLKCIF